MKSFKEIFHGLMSSFSDLCEAKVNFNFLNLFAYDI